MNRKHILAMVEEIIEHADADIWKGIFESPEEPELAAEQIEEFVEIVRKHLHGNWS